jgi:hypothetical protein
MEKRNKSILEGREVHERSRYPKLQARENSMKPRITIGEG